MRPRKPTPGYPDYIKRVTSRGKSYEYFDTGRTANGKRILRRMPPKSDPGYGGTYAALLAARMSLSNLRPERTINELSRAYQKSPEFTKRSASTQNTYFTYLKVIEKEFDQAPLHDLSRKDIRTFIDDMSQKPGAANMALLVMRNMMKFAKKRDWIETDPTDGVEFFEKGDAEYEPWPEYLIEAALADDNVRLPVALLLYTGQRIGDVCKMRWSDIRDGYLYVKQQKTGKELDIRLHSHLSLILSRTPKDAMTILHGPKLRPMKTPALRLRLQKFGEKHGEAVVPHGLRKNAVIALLENEASIAEVSSITGQSLEMVEHYAKRRNNKRIGSAAILKWERGTNRGNRKQVENG